MIRQYVAKVPGKRKKSSQLVKVKACSFSVSDGGHLLFWNDAAQVIMAIRQWETVREVQKRGTYA